MYKKAIPILFVAFSLVVGACSHSSQSESPPAVTLSDAEWERVVTERSIKAVEIKRARPSGDPSGLEDFPNYDFTPDTPEWNTAVVKEAERLSSRVFSVAACFNSLDVFYDFEKFVVTPIDKLIESNLKYVFELLSITRWNALQFELFFNHPAEGIDYSSIDLSSIDLSSIDLPEEEVAELVAEAERGLEELKRMLESIPPEDIAAFETLGIFYAEVRAALGIEGDRSLQGLADKLAYEILPELKENFASIGFESSDAEISEFQDIWEANPEITQAARASLKRIEETETMLLDVLSENNELTGLELSQSILASVRPSLEGGPFPEEIEQLNAPQNTLLLSAAKQSAPPFCYGSGIWFPDTNPYQ